MIYKWMPADACGHYFPELPIEHPAEAWRTVESEAEALTSPNQSLRYARRIDGEKEEWAFGTKGESGWCETADQAYAKFWKQYLAPGSWGGLTI